MIPFLVIGLALAGCGRKLTDAETAYLATVHGDSLDTRPVRLVRGVPVGSITFQRKPRPRVTCRERILPPVKEEVVTTRPAAVALWNRVFFARNWYVDDYLRGYPELMSLSAAMLLAHEMTHVWQWQNRALTGYSPLRAAREHGQSPDPYLFGLGSDRDFLEFGYEQQGAIVEEYVCCRALDPAAERTGRLHDLLAAYLPVTDLPRTGKRERPVLLPWKGARIQGICG